MPSRRACAGMTMDALYPAAARFGAPFHARCEGHALTAFRKLILLCNYRFELEAPAKGAMADYDVIVVGAGNAALAASVSARGAGAERVLVLEKAPEENRGGNTHYSGGLLRIAFDRPRRIVATGAEGARRRGLHRGRRSLSRRRVLAKTFRRMTDGRTDPELGEILIANSYDTACWMAEQGIRFEPAISLGAVRVGNVIKWPKGAIVRAAHEGVGLSRMWLYRGAARGVEIRYGSPALAAGAGSQADA